MENKKHLQIEITPEVADGIYSNLAIIANSPSEFIFDFAKILPGSEKAKVCSRVIMTPIHAKRLLKALAENVNKYESLFGEIEEPTVMSTGFNGGTTGEA